MLYELCGCPYWYELVENLAPHFDRTTMLSFRCRPAEAILDDHTSLLKAIEAKDTAAARTIAARHMQRYLSLIHIFIVVTEHPEYALEALQIFVSGFLLKPANEEDVKNVLKHLRYPPEDGPAGVKIQCFGNFEIFANGRTLAFKRSKSKELLAYLVDRNGATCTNGEMLAVLWEDKPDTASLHSHLRNLIFDLSHALEDAGVTGLLIRGRSTLDIDTGKVDCDYYNFLKGDRSAINSYRGEYMTQYLSLIHI